MRDHLLRSDEMTRRRFAARAASALLGVGLLPSFFGHAAAADPVTPAAARPATAKRVIYLYMAGGMSHLDTLDPKPNTEVAGPVRAIKSSLDGEQVSEYLPRLAECLHLGTVVRSMTSTQGAHEQGNYLMHTSYNLVGTIRHPGMGGWLDHLQGGGHPSLPNHVYIGYDSRHPGAGFLPARHAPLFVSNPENGLTNVVRPKELSAARQSARLALADELDAAFRATYDQAPVRAYADAYDRALSLMASKDLAAFDLTQEAEEVRKRYGQDQLGQGCLLARRLVERGVRYVEVGINGWDTHVANFVRTPELAESLDRALAALLKDLHALGLLKDTLVVLATEFGRTPVINQNLGRDHYPQAFSCALFGGGIKAGNVHGKTTADGSAVEGDKVKIADFNATIAQALGLPLDRIVTSPSGRPFTVANKGVPIQALFA
jgi:Protein of unknown function (DUF1501)